MRNPKTSKNIIKLFIANFLIIVLVCAGFYFMRGTTQIVEVQTIAVNIHQEPSANSEVITQIHREDSVTILDDKQGWYKIQTADKVEGWVADWLIFDGTSGPYTYLPAVITQRKVELKKDNKESSKTLSTLKKKQKVFVTMELNGWSRIYAEDTYGWVPSETLAIRKNQQPKFEDNSTLQITLENAPLYSENSESSPTAGVLTYADKVTLKETLENYWYQVQTEDGTTGYVRSWEVTDNPLKEDDERPAEAKSEYTVLLDPGHGGNDPGAESNDGKVFEKDLTLATAKSVKKELESKGYNVLMTRSKDDFVSLERITTISNDSQADAFVSFHYDSSGVPNEATGTTTFYQQENGRPLAQAVNDKIASTLPLDNRGFASQNYQVLRDNEKPAVLLELGYLNSDLDASYAQSDKYHKKVGEAVEQGVTVYLNQIKKESNQ